MSWTILKKDGDWLKYWQYNESLIGVGIKFIKENNIEKYQAVVTDKTGKERLHSGICSSISDCRRFVQNYMDRIDSKQLILENTINEAYEQYEYSPSLDREELMFDFYLMSSLPHPDNEVLDYVLEDNRKKLYSFLKEHMLEAVYFAVCAEFRHIFDRNTSEQIKSYYSKKDELDFIKKYATYYLSKQSGKAGEFLDRPETKDKHEKD